METFLTYDFSSDAFGQIEIGQKRNDPKLNVKLAERDLWDAFDKVIYLKKSVIKISGLGNLRIKPESGSIKAKMKSR